MSIDDPVLPRVLAARARDCAGRTFLTEIGGAEFTFAETYEIVRRWAAVLRARGVGRGDHVAAMLPNRAPSVQLWLAIGALGSVEVPIHTEYRGRMLAHALDTAGCRLLVIAAQFAERIGEIAGRLDHLEDVLVLDGPVEPPAAGPRMHDGGALLAAAEPRDPEPDLAPHDIGTVLFTSGTTGVSKGVMMPYAQLRATTEGCWPSAHMTGADIYYCMLPGYHVSGKIAVDSMLRVGGRLVLRERFSTGRFWDDVRATGATCACVMGAMAGFLMAQPERDDDADNPLDKVLMLPLPPDVDAFRRRFGLRTHTIFNQTEISCPIVSDGYEPPVPGSCGRVRPGYECRIVDEHDREVPTGTVGELVVRADEPWTQMAGYLGMPQKTVEATRNLWLHTGDAFRVDADGNYFFIDRIKDVIRRRGENISSVEVEDGVLEHPDVLECAAVAVRSEWTEDELKVVVVPRPGHTLAADELFAFLEARMPRFMLPRYIEVADALPKTPTQKVRKAELRTAGGACWDREAARNAIPTKGPA